MQERRRIRALALQALYELDCTTHRAEEVIARYLEGSELSEEGMSFFRQLVIGVVERHKLVDALIHEYAPEWPVDQIAVVDRTILRMAIFELINSVETPIKVAINEAVELAKVYGSDNASRFINGVLGTVATQHGEMIADAHRAKPDIAPTSEPVE